MWSLTFLITTLFASNISARPSGSDAPSSTAISAAIAVRPDWTNKPQGERVLPRLDVNDSSDNPPLDGAKRKEIVYGPWLLGPGKVLSKFQLFAKSPCKNCYVTAIQYTSKYGNGTEILTSDGIWMHHCVMSSLTRARSYTPLGSNILWAGGNERPTLRLNTRYKYGIDWPSNFNFLLEYMSAVEEDVNVSLAITFEYIEKSQPEAEDYKGAYLIWNSVGTPAFKNGSYQMGSSDWVVPKSGVLLHGIGHMHDGGTHVDLFINDKLVCSSRMYYNARPGYGSRTIEASPGSHLMRTDPINFSRRDGPKIEVFGGKHISDPGHCTSFGHVEEGDRMRIQAYYDTVEFNVMSHEGKPEEQMGILRVFIGPDEV